MICNNNISQYQNDAGIDVKPVSSSSFGDKNDLENEIENLLSKVEEYKFSMKIYYKI